MHILFCLRETTYGAQTSITGPNIKNHVIALDATRMEPPVSSYTITMGSTDLVPDISVGALSDRMIKSLSEFQGTCSAERP